MRSRRFVHTDQVCARARSRKLEREPVLSVGTANGQAASAQFLDAARESTLALHPTGGMNRKLLAHEPRYLLARDSATDSVVESGNLAAIAGLERG